MMYHRPARSAAPPPHRALASSAFGPSRARLGGELLVALRDVQTRALAHLVLGRGGRVDEFELLDRAQVLALRREHLAPQQRRLGGGFRLGLGGHEQHAREPRGEKGVRSAVAAEGGRVAPSVAQGNTNASPSVNSALPASSVRREMAASSSATASSADPKPNRAKTATAPRPGDAPEVVARSTTRAARGAGRSTRAAARGAAGRAAARARWMTWRTCRPSAELNTSLPEAVSSNPTLPSNRRTTLIGRACVA